jgi:outer membrane protein assembly factor BamE
MFMSGTSSRALARLLAKLAIPVLAALVAAGCSSSKDRPASRPGKWGFPYRADIQQGNWLTQDQIALLRPGMTREQVRFALGSPTLVNVLHAGRWDYPYFVKLGSGGFQERKFTVWFENDKLARWSGDEQPTLQPFQIEKAKTEAPAANSPAAGAAPANSPPANSPPAGASSAETPPVVDSTGASIFPVNKE